MAHQAKRPYAGTRSTSQSSITSYFQASSPYDTEGERNSTSTYSLPPQQAPASLSSAPTLPHSVQSNLLNVGMRVRKSVPEGYKTGSYSAFTLFSDTSPAVSMPSSTPTTPPKTRPRAGNRELTPFCGILKVGGMAGQQWGIYNPGSGEMDEDRNGEEEVPFLSSQGSTISNVSVEDAVTPGGNKRRFFEDEEQDSHFTMGGISRGLGDRVLAVPRRKKWAGKLPAHAGQVRIFGQENVNAGGADVDFEDAEFLDYGLVGEVEMSGCN